MDKSRSIKKCNSKEKNKNFYHNFNLSNWYMCWIIFSPKKELRIRFTTHWQNINIIFFIPSLRCNRNSCLHYLGNFINLSKKIT
jgi:hypothetical protein